MPHNDAASREARQRAALSQLIELVVLLNDDMTRSLARDGLTVSRAGVVYRLHGGGPCTQRELAEALGVSPRTITGLVDGLAATGFVTRQPHPTDRRATLVTLTEHGERVAEELARSQDEFAEQLFGGMSEATFASFVKGLRTVIGVVQAQLQEGSGA